jgi:hypothetical protein
VTTQNSLPPGPAAKPARRIVGSPFPATPRALPARTKHDSLCLKSYALAHPDALPVHTPRYCWCMCSSCWTKTGLDEEGNQTGMCSCSVCPCRSQGSTVLLL